MDVLTGEATLPTRDLVCLKTFLQKGVAGLSWWSAHLVFGMLRHAVIGSTPRVGHPRNI